MPVKNFQPNPWGLFQVHGNVLTWTEDCWNDSYDDKPDKLKQTGSAWTFGGNSELRYSNAGFRVARTL